METCEGKHYGVLQAPAQLGLCHALEGKAEWGSTLHSKHGLWLRDHLHFSSGASLPPHHQESELTHSSFVRQQALAPGSHLLIFWPDQALITLPPGSEGQPKGHTDFSFLSLRKPLPGDLWSHRKGLERQIPGRPFVLPPALISLPSPIVVEPLVQLKNGC